MRTGYKKISIATLSALIWLAGINYAIFLGNAKAIPTVVNYAQPGQTVSSFLSWAKTKTQLPALKYNSEFQFYDGTKGNMYFYASVTGEKGKVKKEGITVSKDPSIKFSRHNAKSVELIKNLYGAEISSDFKSSIYITQVGRDSFLRGKQYGYSVAQVKDGTNLEIVLLKDLQEKINNAKYCQTHQCDV
jgi:hypothetical protein